MQWISDYYMSPIGDVYKAALPAGLKAEDGYRPKTETCLRLTPQFSSERSQHIAIDMLQRGRQAAEGPHRLNLSGRGWRECHSKCLILS